jgi:hypothetical protein
LFLIKKKNFQIRHPVNIGDRVIVRTENVKVKGKITDLTEAKMSIGDCMLPYDKIRKITVKKTAFYIGRGLYTTSSLAFFIGVNVMYYNAIVITPLIPGTALFLSALVFTSANKYNSQNWDFRFIDTK